jgi:CheY-like chemotaxis protein
MTQLADQPTHSTLMVLHVEKNANAMSIVGQLISRRIDLSLLQVSTGAACLQLAASENPDVIVIETELLDMGGIELIKRLHQGVSTAHIPVIALSTNAYPQGRQDAVEAGVFCYLTKPFKFPDFIQAIDDALLSCESLN